MRPFFRLLTALAAAALVMSAAAAQSTPAERLAQQEQAFTQAHDAVGQLLAVYRIEDFGRLLAPAALETAWTRLAATPQLDPLVGAEIASQQASNDLRAGNAAAAATAWRKLGEVGSWMGVGPFDNSGAAAITSAQGPETGAGLAHIDFKAHYAGKLRAVSWRMLPYASTLGEVRLGAYLSPSQSVSAYLVSWVRSPEAQAVALRLRDNGATRIWVNGAVVFEEQGTHTSAGFDQHAAGARLRAGWNQMVAKVGVGESGDWRFSLRLTTPAGVPLELEASATAPAEAGAAGAAAADAAVTVRDLAADAKAGATTPAGKLAYAWVLNHKQNFNEGDHSDANAFMDAVAAAPGDAVAVLDFVEHDADQSRRYQYVETLMESAGAAGASWSRRAHLDRGTIELGRTEYWPARDDFWAALGQSGAAGGGIVAPAAAIAQSPLAALGMLETYAGMGVRPQAMAWAEAIEAAGAPPPAVAAPTATLLERMGVVAEALRWMKMAHQQDAASLATSLRLADAERHSGDLEGALATLRQARQLDGEEPALLEAEARALSGLGRGPEAMALAQQAVTLAPDAPETHVAQGEIERHFGHTAAGLAGWQTALGLNPQDSDLRDRLRLAQGGEAAKEASFEKPYTQDLARTMAAFAAEPPAQRSAEETGPVVVLADTTVTNVFPSGNTGRYVQQIFRINNRQGADSLSVYSVTYDPAAEAVQYLSAHVVHADGSSADAPQAGDEPIRESVGYETFYNVRNKFVELPPMREGDYLEIAYRVLPTTLESLYGDYFGDVATFGSEAPTLFQQCVVITPASKPLYFKAVRFHGESEQHTAGGETVYRWTARNLAAQVDEPSAPPQIEQAGYIAVSAFRTWDQFGAWYRQLIRDTFGMDSEMVATVNQLVAGKTTEEEKVDAIYRWVIQNTHYVALEFGIHGYRPYPVTLVFHRRFGDCKDKASLLIAMLHQAGIGSEFVLVRVRELGLIDPTIPSVADFDHAIVYVPSLHRYLDGTAEYNGADELPEGDQRAFVLRLPVDTDLAADTAAPAVVAARLPTTPAGLAPEVTAEQPASKNVSSRTLIGQLDAQGNLHFQMDWIVTGGDAPQLRQALELPDRRTGALQAMLHDRLPGITVTDAEVKNVDDWDQPIEVNLQGVVPRFATVNGTALLIPRQIVPHAWLPDMAALGTRQSDVLLGPPQIRVDEMHLALPPGYRLSGLPPASHLQQPFGNFTAAVGMNGDTLTLESRLETTQSLIAPAGYAAFRSFWTEVDATLGRALTATAGSSAAPEGASAPKVDAGASGTMAAVLAVSAPAIQVMCARTGGIACATAAAGEVAATEDGSGLETAPAPAMGARTGRIACATAAAGEVAAAETAFGPYEDVEEEECASAPVAEAAQAAAAAPRSLLDRLPRVEKGGYAKALAAARARGEAGRAEALWVELFYGDAAAQAEAEIALQAPAGTANDAEMDFVRFVAAYVQGQDRAMLAAALRLTEAAPNDVATELAVRTLSGQLENQGQGLLNAVPSLERALREPLRDPTTSYMLGRPLLAAVHAPGLALTQAQAMELAGRLAHWQEWGPFGDFQNLAFDQKFALEQGAAASYRDGGETRQAQGYENVGDGVRFPQDWGEQGVDFGVTYVRAAAPTQVQLRLYTPASVVVEINGSEVLRNDRRSSYTAATATGAVELAAGWNRVVVKLAGEGSRTFDLMLRPENPATVLENAAALPAGAGLAAAPRKLEAPETLAEWSAARLAEDKGDTVALWVDGIRRLQDEDAEHARVELQTASDEAPQAAAVWLELAQAYGQLSDASQSWVAAQVERTAQQALKASPRALRAYDRLGHVYQSEGKTTEAAEQFAHCSNKGFATCDWSAFGLAAQQRWLPEAQAALEHALAESGSDWGGIANGLEFYSSIGAAAPLGEWERVMAADPRAAGTLGNYELRHGHAAQAAGLLRTAIGFDPSSPELRQQQVDALLLSGQAAAAQQAAQQALADFPHDWRVAAAADEVGLRQDALRGIAALRATDYRRNVLRHEADFLAGDKFWQPWYHSAAEILKDAPGKDEYPNASSILVFDQMVNRINPDSTQDQYIHQIFRVLNAVGISELGDVKTIPPGSDLITVRTIKQDGKMLLPERMGNITSISMPGLEAGDYIEVEFVQHSAASPVIPGTMDNSSFFVFNSSTQPYHYSDYIVLTPAQYPLQVDQERFPTAPTVRTLADGWTAREWLVQKTRILVTEPHMPPEQNLVPKVWVSSQMSWEQISRYLADHEYAVRKTTPEMQAEAEQLVTGQSSDIGRADAIFNWVVANIQPGDGSMLVPARQYFTDRNGNRTATFLGLLAAAHVPFELVMAKAVTDDSSTTIPSLFQFQYPLIHVIGAGSSAPDSPAGWYDLNNDFAEVGYLVPGIRGGLAVEAAASGAADFFRIPSYSSPLDGVALRVTGTVAESGDAQIHLEIEFRGPNGEQVRSALANQPDSTLPQIYQQMLLSNYPNGTASGGHLINRDDKSKPLIIAIDATVPDLVHSDAAAAGSGWNIERLAGAVGVLARYAPLPFRTEPLVIGGDSFEQTQVTLTLPARFGTATLPAAATLDNPFGQFTSNFTQKAAAGGGDTIEFNRRFYLKANLVGPKQYGAFRGFAEAVDQQDRLQLTGTVR